MTSLFGNSQPQFESSTQQSAPPQEATNNLQNEALSSQPQPTEGQWRANPYSSQGIAPIFGTIPGTGDSNGFVPGQSDSIPGAPIYQPGQTSIPSDTTPTPFGASGFQGTYTSPNYNTPSEGTYSQVPTFTQQEQPGGSYQQEGPTGPSTVGQQPGGTAFAPGESGTATSQGQSSSSPESSSSGQSSGQNGSPAFNPNSGPSAGSDGGSSSSGSSGSSGPIETPTKPIGWFFGGILGAAGGYVGARVLPKFGDRAASIILSRKPAEAPAAEPAEGVAPAAEHTPAEGVTSVAEHAPAEGVAPSEPLHFTEPAPTPEAAPAESPDLHTTTPTPAGGDSPAANFARTAGGAAPGDTATTTGHLSAEVGAPAAETTAETTSTSTKTIAEHLFGKDGYAKLNGISDRVTSRLGAGKSDGMLTNLATRWQTEVGYPNAERTNLQGLLKSTNEQLAPLKAQEAAGTLPEDKEALLTDLNTRNILLSAGPEAPDELNPSLFTKQGIANIARAQGGDTPLFDGDAAKILDSHASNLEKAFPTVPEDLSLFQKPGVIDAAKGGALAGGFLLGNSILDKVTHTNGAINIGTIALPAAVLLKGNGPGGPEWGQKVLWGAGAMGVSLAIDKILPASSHPELSHIFAPNKNDAFLMTAALMLPTDSNRVKFGLTAGAYAFDRMTASNFTTAAVGTGALMGGTYLATRLGEDAKFGLNPDALVPALAVEGGAFVASRVVKEMHL